MITVSIAINGEPIFARSAKNHVVKNRDDETKYVTDAGDVIWHKSDMENGAIELAKSMLDSIKTENVQYQGFDMTVLWQVTRKDNYAVNDCFFTSYESAERFMRKMRVCHEYWHVVECSAIG